MTWQSFITISALALGLGGCMGSSENLAPGQSPRLSSERDLDRQLGHRVRIIGEATNTDHGPCVVDAGFAVYLDEYRKFPGDIVGRKIEAAGIIDREGRLGGFARVVNGKAMILLKDATYSVINSAPVAGSL